MSNVNKEEADIIVFADGGSRGNPGHAAYGFVIEDKKGEILHEEGKYIGITTNNVAEYTGLIEALQWIGKNLDVSNKSITVFLDSLLVASQMVGTYRVKDIKLIKLFFKAKELEKKLSVVAYQHIPRDKNIVADALLNQALDNLSQKK